MCFYIINHKLPSCICKDVYSLRFAQVFEDERGLAGGEVMLHLVVATILKCIAEIWIILNPAVQMANSCSTGRVWEIGKRQGELII